MCDPVSATLVAATAVTAMGQVMQGAQAKAQGKYEQNVAQQNRALTIGQQRDAIAQQARDRATLDRKYSQIQGDQQAAFGANGIDANFGSARTVAEDTAMLRAEDATNLYANQAEKIRGFDISAANEQSKGDAALMRGNNAFTSSLFSAGGTILGGASQYSKIKANQKMGYGG
jgi:hypothetical protein